MDPCRFYISPALCGLPNIQTRCFFGWHLSWSMSWNPHSAIAGVLNMYLKYPSISGSFGGGFGFSKSILVCLFQLPRTPQFATIGVLTEPRTSRTFCRVCRSRLAHPGEDLGMPIDHLHPWAQCRKVGSVELNPKKNLSFQVIWILQNLGRIIVFFPEGSHENSCC